MEQMLYAIDQRDNIRVPASVKVILIFNNQPVMNTQTINISRDGMMLDTGNTTFEKHDLIDIEFQDMSGATQQWYLLSAEVVHSSSEGIGVRILRSSTMHSLMSHMVFGKLYHAYQ